ncbi:MULTISPECIES: hypothetical protein [unclassified Streptomyces]|uniref:hypothetical protein n=1 Tax=unclassified Streptomyces TaxID=2593676 RepID=UPI0022B68003|nr:MULTISPECIES: hypothetical protein [unclassified Streptomyces]MCZ7417186.1 hypothetical protein [Streptomyces sp. WMMC897]MCZ7432985.1 hypothetical protein [Streptomyces sp. WMMC1477]
MVHALPRPLARALGGLALAGLLTGGLAGGARAADAPLPVAITGPEQVALSLTTEDDRSEPQIDLGLSAPDDGEHGPDEDGITYPVFSGGYTLTIDASQLAGVADVKLVDGADCTTEGLVFVCPGYEIYPGERPYDVPDLRLDVNDGSQAGESGTIEVTGEAEGVDFTGLSVDVLVGQAELHMRTLAEPEGFAPGDTYEAPLGFRNVGGTPAADGVVLRFSGSRGLSFPGSYGNCAYADTGYPLIESQTLVLCRFEGSFAAGAAYEVSEPVAVKTAEFAHLDSFSYSFSAVTLEEAEQVTPDLDFTRGTGAALELTAVPGADPGRYARWADLDFPTGGTYDFALTAGSARGAKGDTVTVDVDFANHGPAWVGNLRSGGEPFAFHVEIPRGAGVVKAPRSCNPLSQSGETSTSAYLCWLSTPVMEDDQRSFPFELRVDEVVENAKGRVFFGYVPPRDADEGNNESWIVLNGPDDGSWDSGSSGGSGDGGADGDGDSGKGDGDGSGDTGGTGSTGSTGGADGSGDGAGKDAAEGDLALTGAGGVLLLVGGSLVVLGAGVAVYWAARRRSAVSAV